MFKIKVVTVGKCKEKWLAEALAEYEKRMPLQIEWVLVKDDSQLKTEPFYMALDRKGKMLSSREWSQKLIDLLTKGGSRLTIFIGGAEGLPEEILQKAAFVWSLSPLIFTHQLTRLILLEQLYRALEIAKGSGYHKET